MPELPLAVTVVSIENPSVRVLKLTGPLTLTNMFEFQNLIRTEDERASVVDMADVPYVDSAGIGCLVGAQLFHQRTHRRLSLVGLNQRIKDVLKMTAVDGLFNLHDTIESATDSNTKTTTA